MGGHGQTSIYPNYTAARKFVEKNEEAGLAVTVTSGNVFGRLEADLPCPPSPSTWMRCPGGRRDGPWA